MVDATGGRVRVEDLLGLLQAENAGPPISGNTGSRAGIARPGGLLFDTVNHVLYTNEGSVSCPVWTPCGFNQANIWGVHTIFEDAVGVAAAGTGTETIIAGSGLRVFGQGIAEIDSGFVAQAAGEGGKTMRFITTNEDAHTLAIGLEAGRMQPDQHGTLVIDVDITQVSALTSRAIFCGFLGTAASALDPAVTGATTVATLVQDDLAGLWMDAGLTDADRFYAVHNKSDEAATQDLTSDGDTGVNLAAVGTWQRLRVEIDKDGNMACFINGAQVYQRDSCLDAIEECTPVLYIESQTTAVQSMDIRRFSAWASRSAS